MSFEPVSADMQIVMQSGSGNTDYYVGLSYAEGLGKVNGSCYGILELL